MVECARRPALDVNTCASFSVVAFDVGFHNIHLVDNVMKLRVGRLFFVVGFHHTSLCFLFCSFIFQLER